MSHNIQELDIITATEATWHGLEKRVDAIDFETSGLDWDVVESPIYLGKDEGGLIEIPGYNAIEIPEQDHVIGVSKESYEIIQNSEIWELINDAFTGVEFEVTCAGSLGNLSKVFFSLQLKEHQSYLVNGDAFKSHFNFLSSHDGSQCFVGFDSHTRVVCGNTFKWSQRDRGSAKAGFRVRHTKNAKRYIDNAAKAIEATLQKRAEFYASLGELDEREISRNKVLQALVGWIAPKDAKSKDDISTVTKNKIRSMRMKFANGIANKGKTRYDFFNAVTEQFTHHNVASDAGKNFGASEFGSGAARKAEAYDFLTDDDKLDALVARGEAILQG